MKKRNDDYADVPDYERKISQIRSEINRLEEQKRGGEHINGGLIDLRMVEFDLKKRHVLAQAYSLAKKQNKEAVVARLLKSARAANYFHQHDSYDLLGKLGYHRLSRLKKASIALGSAALAISALTGTWAPVAAGALAFYISKAAHDRIKQKSAQYDLNELKSYVKTGKLR